MTPSQVENRRWCELARYHTRCRAALADGAAATTAATIVNAMTGGTPL